MYGSWDGWLVSTGDSLRGTGGGGAGIEVAAEGASGSEVFVDMDADIADKAAAAA